MISQYPGPSSSLAVLLFFTGDRLKGICCFLISMCAFPCFADETCGNGYTLVSTLPATSTVAPLAGTCYAGYTMYTGNLGNFRFVPAGTGVVCPAGQHMSGGTCVNDTIGNCATGFHDATINAAAAVQPLGGTCYAGYQPQQTIRNVSYLIRSAVSTCGSGEYPTASGCAQNPTENCPSDFFAPVPSSAFVRADENDTCPTNYSMYGDMDFCRKYLGFANMADFCTPQLLCAAGATTMRSSTGMILPIYRERATQPSYYIKFESGDICYANVAPGFGSGTIHGIYNNQVYHGVE